MIPFSPWKISSCAEAPFYLFFLGVLEVNDKFYFIKNNSERPLDALAEKHQ